MLSGKPVSLTILDFGEFLVTAAEAPRLIGIMGALLRTDAGETVLIDSGFPLKYAEDREAAAAEDGLGGFGHLTRHGPENWVMAQLAAQGVDQIDLMLQTHTHIDHVGGLGAFPGVPIVVGKGEREMSRPLYFGEAQPMVWPEAEYLVVDADQEIGPGVELLYAPGHAPGLFALSIALPDTGTVLWAGDAISRASEPEEGFPGAWDPALALHHAWRLLARPYDMLIYGHDPEQWKVLPKGVPLT